MINPLITNSTKWSNTLKQFVGKKLPTNCLSVFDYFVGLALKGSTALFSPVEKGLQGLNLQLISIQDVLVSLEPQFIYINILKSKTKGVNQRKL